MPLKRNSLTKDQRSLPLKQNIDPGFVHKRKIQTIIGQKNMTVIDRLIDKLPDLPEWQRTVRIDHIYKDVFLKFCELNGVAPLEQLLCEKKGGIFCSTEMLAPSTEVYTAERVISRWVPRGESDMQIEFHYSTNLISSETLRTNLHQGAELSIVAELHKATENLLVFHPILIGFPSLRAEETIWKDEMMWWPGEFFENFIEDVDEFNLVNKTERPSDVEPMKLVSEQAFKKCLCHILGDAPTKDWGGETSDHFTSNIHLGGLRMTAAFLLKGPARFYPMGLNHLGKNNDQIVRLAQEPADILIVQHCHEILPAVRSTLRAFAVQPSKGRRYCLIDGKDSLWLLQAYNLYDKAVEWSQ